MTYYMRVVVEYKTRPGISKTIEVERKQFGNRSDITHRTAVEDVKRELDRLFQPKPDYNTQKV